MTTMQASKIAQIFHKYFQGLTPVDIQAYGNGHIHDTYRIRTNDGPEFILQKLNTHVFPKPEILIDNHLRLQSKIAELSKPAFLIPRIHPCHTGKYLFVDAVGDNWRLTDFIRDSYSIDRMESLNLAHEAGRAYGWFIQLGADQNSDDYTLSIPFFHDLDHRIGQLEQAIHEDRANRVALYANTIDFYLEGKAVFDPLLEKVGKGAIPERITHNDTKINNVLFRKEKAVAVIDLDTIGPGIVHYDYGDSLRTIANLAVEDEKDLSKVGLNLQAFEAFTKGYLSKSSEILNLEEIESLHLAPRLMTWIIGSRFLTDLLNGDNYFKTSYPEHNLVRCQVQQRLLQSMEEHENFMEDTIGQILKNKL